MNTTFTIDDPLDGQAVTIIITLPTSEQPTDQRQALVSVGVAQEMPVIKTGILGNISDLIHEAWKVFGVQALVTKAETEAAEKVNAAESETACTERVEVAVSPELIAAVAIEAEAPAIVEANTTEVSAPKPAANLNLF